MKQSGLKRFQKVHLKDGIEAKVINPVHETYWDDKGNKVDLGVLGYRLTDGQRPAYWFTVPAHMIKELDSGEAER